MLVWLGLFGLVASFHGIIMGYSRQIFALARAGFLPAPLAHVHPHFRTPHIATLAGGAVGIVAIYSDSLVTIAGQSLTASIVTMAVFGALVMYGMSMASLFRLRRREPNLARRTAPVLSLRARLRSGLGRGLLPRPGDLQPADLRSFPHRHGDNSCGKPARAPGRPGDGRGRWRFRVSADLIIGGRLPAPDPQPTVPRSSASTGMQELGRPASGPLATGDMPCEIAAGWFAEDAAEHRDEIAGVGIAERVGDLCDCRTIGQPFSCMDETSLQPPAAEAHAGLHLEVPPRRALREPRGPRHRLQCAPLAGSANWSRPMESDPQYAGTCFQTPSPPIQARSASTDGGLRTPTLRPHALFSPVLPWCSLTASQRSSPR